MKNLMRRVPTGTKSLTIVLSAGLLGGCAAALQNGPDRLFPVDAQLANLQQMLPLPDLRYAHSKLERNNYITARMYAIDLSYTQYFTNLTKQRQLDTLASDVAIVGLGAATTVIPGASAKAAIGAATTAVAGTRTAIDKDVLVQQTIQILQNQMEISRSSIRTRLSANLTKSSAAYTMAQGMSDLEDYYRAGTLAGALEAVSATVGDNAQQHKDLQNGVTQSAAAVTPTALGETSSGVSVKGFAGTRR